MFLTTQAVEHLINFDPRAFRIGMYHLASCQLRIGLRCDVSQIVPVKVLTLISGDDIKK